MNAEMSGVVSAQRMKTRQDNFLMSQSCCEAMLSMPVPNQMICGGLSNNEIDAIEWITEFGFS